MLHRHAAFLAAALAAPAFCAPGADLRFGVQATLSSPQADLKTLTDSGTGLGGGLFLERGLGRGRALRTRLDIIAYPGVAFRDPGYPDDHRRWSQRSLGVEYVFHPSGREKGFCISLGLAANALHQTLSYGTTTEEVSTTRVGLAAGLGYDFTSHWGASLRYTRTEVGRIEFAALDAGVAYRF